MPIISYKKTEMKYKFYSLFLIFLLFFSTLFGVNVDFEYKNHCINNIIYFEDLSSSENKIVAWYWEFGDGSVANDNSPVHVYTESGNYIVKLTIKTELGKAYSQIKNIVINTAPFAFFNPNSKCDQSVGFTDNSFTKSAEVKQWIWDFGDGNYSMEKNPNHKFNRATKSKVHLKVIDKNGCTDSITQLVKIKKKPVVGFDIKNVLLSNPAYVKIKSHNFEDSVSFHTKDKIVHQTSALFATNPYESNVIKQKVKNQMGCVDSLSAVVSPRRDFRISLPAYFQPQNKNYTSHFGVNNNNLVVREFSVFNEKGYQVFYACNNTLWNGRDKQGALCKSGKYTYLLEYENTEHVTIIQKGKFILKN